MVAFPTGDISFHPLADLFPLIEGQQFEDLVGSIRENGQLDAIILLDGTILDGRNRFRACKAAGVQPRFEVFSGENPAKFVAAKNVHRRNLTTNERALIAAKMAGLANGSNQHAKREKSEGDVETSPCVSLSQAAELMGVARDTVVSAKTIIDHGSEIDIASARKGAGLRPMADKIRASFTPEQRAAREREQAERNASSNRANPDRIRTQQMHAEVWEQLRIAMEALTALPLPSDVVGIVKGNAARRRATENKCAAAAKWLSDFAQQWEARDGQR
ncbi:ParB N-terminal domain-containing protein [Methylobacterium sp. C25]|uniref:ParB N-terminal domain-containing protein n=1 Tax=Methylobacterium sp. C25 TaxID=2721622 RepID=UPI001F3029A6|nr:ParB N-terminal domain-containing protein [Methylobacterium sp. C25]MCE4223439.1 ParB N-terminal domain-containing protein [Methylobacterium sp. C25]